MGLAGASSLLAGGRQVGAEPVLGAAYRTFVPELFDTPRRAPAHSETIVIGSGFGAAVAALRVRRSRCSNAVRSGRSILAARSSPTISRRTGGRSGVEADSHR